MAKYHELLERSIQLRNLEESKNKRLEAKTERYEKALNEQREEIEELREARINRINIRRKHREVIQKEMLETALKGIYIAALEECTSLSKHNYVLAESLIENFVSERGSENILANMKGKTYLLNTLYEAIEEAEEEAEETTDDNDAEAENVPDEPKEKMMDKLDKEDDVQNAVKIISDRIADAEQEFIKKNAEDKEKIENIVNDINDRIASIKADNTTPEDQKEEIAQETATLGKRKVNAVYNNRSHSVFETMVHSIMNTIVKDPNLKTQYVNEDGELDTLKIIDTAKCMYGMLEFTNTIQLETVNEEYIQKALSELE